MIIHLDLMCCRRGWECTWFLFDIAYKALCSMWGLCVIPIWNEWCTICEKESRMNRVNVRKRGQDIWEIREMDLDQQSLSNQQKNQQSLTSQDYATPSLWWLVLDFSADADGHLSCLNSASHQELNCHHSSDRGSAVFEQDVFWKLPGRRITITGNSFTWKCKL